MQCGLAAVPVLYNGVKISGINSSNVCYGVYGSEIEAYTSLDSISVSLISIRPTLGLRASQNLIIDNFWNNYEVKAQL